MNGRKKQILEAAMGCFARKGFQGTSIQEIADELGMAKGSIYFYFKSKDDLLLEVIAYIGQKLIAGMAELPEERHLPPRERFRSQLKRHFASFRENKDLPLMLMREPYAVESQRTRLHEMVVDFQRRFLKWLRQHIDEIYGEEAAPYAGDAAASVSGVMMEYTKMLLIGRQPLDENRLADFIADRMDDLMNGMIRSKERPLLGRDYGLDRSDSSPAAGYEEAVRNAVRELREQVEREPVTDKDEERRSDLLSALILLEEQFAEPFPDRIVVRGMLAYMKELSLPSWAEACRRLEEAVAAKA